MTKRVNCENCLHFNPNVFDDNNPDKRIQKASCKLGKRIMFRMPTAENEYFSDEWGYVRWCDDYLFDNVIKIK